MAKINNYPNLPGSALALADKLAITDASASEKTKHVTIEGLDYRYALKSNIVASALGIKYYWVDAADRIAETGMVAGEFGYMSDTTANRTAGVVGDLYQYIVTTWTLVGRVLLDGSVYSYDFQGSGNYLLNWQTIQDIQPFQALYLDGVAVGDGVLVPDNSRYSGLFMQGGTYLCSFNAFSSGALNLGSFYQKTISHYLRFLNAAGQIRFTHKFSTTDGSWSIPAINFNKNSKIGVSYNASSVSNVPIITLDGVPQVITAISIPVGTAVSDSGSDMYFGNASAGNITFDGVLKEEVLLNREMSSDELKIHTSNPNLAIDPADEGGSNVDLTSGTVTTGKKYRTVTFIAGDDFSNIADTGAAANATGAEWTATGTTPTTWTNSSVLNQLGCTYRAKPQDIIPGFWKDSSGNGNHGARTGGEIVNASEQLFEVPGTFTPGVQGESTAGTYTGTFSGEYLKHGSQVTVNIELQNITQSSAGTGNLLITGLPFTISVATANFVIGGVLLAGINYAASASVFVRGSDGETVLRVKENSTGGLVGTVSITDIVSGSSDIWCQITYKTDE